MVHVIVDGIMYSFGVFYPVFLECFHESKSTTSWVLSIMTGLSCIIGPVSSAFTNRFGCRTATIAGAIVGFLGLITSIGATDIIHLYFTIGVILGIGIGLITIPNVVVVACYFEEKRALANGIALSGSGIGMVVMAPFFSFLITTYEWRGALLIISALMLNCCVFALLFKPIVTSKSRPQQNSSEDEITLKYKAASSKINIHPSQSREYVMPTGGVTSQQSVPYISGDILHLSRPYVSEPYGRCRSSTQSGLMYYTDILYGSNIPILCEGSEIVSDQRKEPRAPKLLKKKCKWCPKEMVDGFFQMFQFSMMKNPRFLLLGLCYFLFSIGLTVPYLYTIAKAIEDKIATPEQASLLVSVVGIHNTAARISSGFLVKLFSVGCMPICCICFVICGIATALSVLADQYYQVVIYCAVFGATTGITTTLLSLILVDLFGLENLTNTFGLLLMYIGAATFIGPPINGVLYDIRVQHDVGFFFSGAIMALSGILLFVVPYVKTTGD